MPCELPSWKSADRRRTRGDTCTVQSSAPDPGTTGRHRRVEATPEPLTRTARHRAVTNQAVSAVAPRRRHAADAAPPTHPDARPRPRGRAPQRLLAGTALLAIALAPVLERSASALGEHDAIA